eukprot:scaffold105851_cov31-Tisochrysis_lutea.AAC.3
MSSSSSDEAEETASLLPARLVSCSEHELLFLDSQAPSDKPPAASKSSSPGLPKTRIAAASASSSDMPPSEGLSPESPRTSFGQSEFILSALSDALAVSIRPEPPKTSATSRSGGGSSTPQVAATPSTYLRTAAFSAPVSGSFNALRREPAPPPPTEPPIARPLDEKNATRAAENLRRQTA